MVLENNADTECPCILSIITQMCLSAKLLAFICMNVQIYRPSVSPLCYPGLLGLTMHVIGG